MNWSQSYSASWRIFRVNRKTWADAEMLKNVDKVSISRTADGNLLESGGLDVTGEFDADYYRIVMTAEQGGESARVDVATLFFDSSGGEDDYGRTAYKVDGYSVLRPADTTAILIGEYAPAKADGANYAANLLRGAINAPVHVEGSFELNDHVVFELGSSVLEAVWSILEAGDFVIQIDGRGEVHIKPKPKEPSLIINNSSKRILFNSIDFEANKADIPNRYIVIDDNHITTAVNDDVNSEVSTVRRGFFVDTVDTSPTLTDNETLSGYAKRKLREASILKDVKSYKREYAPNVYPYSLIRASVSSLFGDLRVESQSIDCSNGITVTEKASREIHLW